MERREEIVAQETKALTWAVVLGWNHAEDTVECLRSVAASEGVAVKLLYVDNGSDPDQVAKVLKEVPQAAVVRYSRNVGVARAFNGGFAYALRRGAAFIWVVTNDAVVEKNCLGKLMAEARHEPRSAMLVPKVNYYEHKDVVWSAGSRFRRFPPVIVMRKTTTPDDGRYDNRRKLEFTTLFAVLIRGQVLREVGLLDPSYVYFYEDYDLSLRIRDAGHTITFVPEAKSWHKVALVSRDHRSSPAFWSTYGRGEAIFRRRHQRRWWLTGAVHLAYILARTVFEGKVTGVLNFWKGYREGCGANLNQVPGWNTDTVDPVEVVREG